MITAQDAVDDLYRIAVTEEKATSTSRLDVLADFCVQELTRRGLKQVEKEASIPGAGREKKWDVAWQYDGKYRLGISLKSLLKNLRGTVPNRIDDLIGEVANAQLHSPEIVIGYIMIFNVAEDSLSQKARLDVVRPLSRARDVAFRPSAAVLDYGNRGGLRAGGGGFQFRSTDPGDVADLRRILRHAGRAGQGEEPQRHCVGIVGDDKSKLKQRQENRERLSFCLGEPAS